MIRTGFLMHVNPDKHEEYERRHEAIWPEMVDVLRGHGASNYSIFLDASSSQLFAYVEIESEARWAAVAETDVCRRWWEHMKDVMATNADGSPVAAELKRVFYME